jgi:hypothetical protein
MMAVAGGEGYKDLFKREGIEVECPPLIMNRRRKRSKEEIC